MGVLHSVGSRGAVQLDRYYGAVSRERVADLHTETSRNGGRSRILVAGVASRSAYRAITDPHVVNREIEPRARKLRNNRDFALR